MVCFEAMAKIWMNNLFQRTLLEGFEVQREILLEVAEPEIGGIWQEDASACNILLEVAEPEIGGIWQNDASARKILLVADPKIGHYMTYTCFLLKLYPSLTSQAF